LVAQVADKPGCYRGTALGGEQPTKEGCVMAHTPGPWFYQEESDAYTHIVRAHGGRFITQLSQNRDGEAEANARLIARAPYMADEIQRLLDVNADLLAALNKAYRIMCSGTPPHSVRETNARRVLRLAIAQAEPPETTQGKEAS
jgi:hypothetical protein